MINFDFYVFFRVFLASFAIELQHVDTVPSGSSFYRDKQKSIKLASGYSFRLYNNRMLKKFYIKKEFFVQKRDANVTDHY